MSIWFTINAKAKVMSAALCAFFPLHMYRMHYFPLRIHIVMRKFCRIREYDTLLTFYYILLHSPHSVGLSILRDHKYELWIGWGRALVWHAYYSIF